MQHVNKRIVQGYSHNEIEVISTDHSFRIVFPSPKDTYKNYLGECIRMVKLPTPSFVSYKKCLQILRF